MKPHHHAADAATVAAERPTKMASEGYPTEAESKVRETKPVSPDCTEGTFPAAQPDPSATDPERLISKRTATVIAMLAIRGGHVVHKLVGGEFLVTWRGHHKHCADLAELEAHARRVGAVQ